MYLKTFEINALKYINLSLLIFSCTRISKTGILKKEKEQLEPLTAMILLLEKYIRGGMCHAIHQYAEANKKYMKYYYKNKELSYHKYWDANNL